MTLNTGCIRDESGRRWYPGRWSSLVLILSVLMVGCQRSEVDPEQKAKQPPNLVIIMADDLGYGDISAFRDGWIETPHLERMADEGMRLTDFHSGGPVCSPTRASLVTGRYQQRAGLEEVVYAARGRNRHHGLHQKEFTIGELAKKAGYQTGVFGKWHLGYRKRYNPTRNGFDRFQGFVSGNVDYFSHRDGIGVHDWWSGDEKTHEDGYSTHLITQHAIQFIEENQEQPFLLYVAHEAPHWPYQGPSDEAIRTGEGEKARTPPRQTDDVEYVRSRYRQMVHEMDKGVGQLMKTLERLDLAENTLVLFFSDNGAKKPYGSAGNLRGWKGSVFEGGHRVPAIAKWPGRVEAGSSSDETAITLDILPTVAELIGAEPPEGLELDGVSLVPVLLDGQDLPERPLFWSWQGQEAMRKGDWKLVRSAFEANSDRERIEGARLYNLEKDPDESENLAGQHATRVERMEAALDSWRRQVTEGATQQPEK